MCYSQEILMLLDLTDSLSQYVKGNFENMLKSIWDTHDFLMDGTAGQPMIKENSNV